MHDLNVFRVASGRPRRNDTSKVFSTPSLKIMERLEGKDG